MRAQQQTTHRRPQTAHGFCHLAVAPLQQEQYTLINSNIFTIVSITNSIVTADNSGTIPRCSLSLLCN